MKLGFDFEIKVADDTGHISGYGAAFGNVDLGFDLIEEGAFSDSINAFQKSGKYPPLLWQHDQAEPIGPITSLKEDKKGLVLEADLMMDLPTAQKAHTLAQKKLVRGLSIGFLVPKGGSQWRDDGVRVLKTIDLKEVSLVTIPQNPLAEVTAVKTALESGELPAPRILERILRDAGFSRRQAKAFLADGYAGLNLRDAVDADEDEPTIAAAIKLLEALNK